MLCNNACSAITPVIAIAFVSEMGLLIEAASERNCRTHAKTAIWYGNATLHQIELQFGLKTGLETGLLR